VGSLSSMKVIVIAESDFLNLSNWIFFEKHTWWSQSP
jgi:hypothetical protein